MPENSTLFSPFRCAAFIGQYALGDVLRRKHAKPGAIQVPGTNGTVHLAL